MNETKRACNPDLDEARALARELWNSDGVSLDLYERVERGDYPWLTEVTPEEQAALETMLAQRRAADHQMMSRTFAPIDAYLNERSA